MPSAVPKRQELMSIAEFESFLEGLGDEAKLYELVDGFLVMMSNPTRRHEQIAGNIGARLKLAMDGRGCESFQGGVRVQRSPDKRAGDMPKPDVVVRCGPTDPDAEQLTFLDDPVIVVEVLSPSTMDVDRGPKLRFYKSLQSLQHIVIVYQDQMRVEHYRRGEKRWATLVALTKPDEVLELSAVEFSMTVAEVYFGVTIT
jgi:Uma2 family endonuclease